MDDRLTKKQLERMQRIVERFDETSEYIVDGNGDAICALHGEGETQLIRVTREGKSQRIDVLVEGPYSAPRI